MKNIALAVGLIAGGLILGVAGTRFFSKDAPAPGLSSAPVAPVALPPGLPRLEESDEYARAKAAALSADPAFAAWLKTENLLSRLALATSLIARDEVPRDALSFLAPKGKYAVVRRGGKIYADPRDAARYDGAAAVVSSLDANAVAAFLRGVEPLLDLAGDRGERGGFRAAFSLAVIRLGQTPAATAEPELRETKKGIVYAYADESLEKLGPARKQLLRMGPKNQAAVQAKLEEILKAL